jgi:hypothetical protein
LIPAWRDYVYHPTHFDIGGQDTWAAYLASYNANYRASGILFHKLDDLNSNIGLCRGLTAALGLNNPVKAVWDAIPYSFLIGWFGKFGSMLTSLAAQPFTGLWQISDVTCSVKERAEIDLLFNPTYSKYLSGKLTVGRAVVKRYTRVVGLPVQPWNYDLLGLSPQQLALMIALVGSRA